MQLPTVGSANDLNVDPKLVIRLPPANPDPRLLGEVGDLLHTNSCRSISIGYFLENGE